MELELLLSLLHGARVRGRSAVTLTGLSFNSKTTEPGELFFCLRGHESDGHLHAPEAQARGAAALVVEEWLALEIPQIMVPDSRSALSAVGRYFYGDPASRLGLVGVTGTNGKTTTAFYIRSVLGQMGAPVGMAGTVYNHVGSTPEPSWLTTPESLDLWRLLARAERGGCRWVVMEVSSHALSMRRVDPADLDIAVITNITRDHFEFHGSFAHYLESKARLVRGLTPQPKGRFPKAAVLNLDDPHVAALSPDPAIAAITYGFSPGADVTATNLHLDAGSSRFLLHLPGATPTPVCLPMPGQFNVANALAAAAVGWLAGLGPGEIAAGLAISGQVPGRAEPIEEGQAFLVLVDFAHNPDALAKLLTLRPPSPSGRRLLLFGAEGGKDRGKRPEMGAAARAADLVIITSDNIHKEEPEQVAAEIAQGLGERPYEMILDRRAAIARVLELAEPGDLVLIAGKGHEQTWVFDGRRIPFDDREVARELLREQAAREVNRPSL